LNVGDVKNWYSQHWPGVEIGGVVSFKCFFCWQDLEIGMRVVVREHLIRINSSLANSRGEILRIISAQEGGSIYLVRLESGEEHFFIKAELRKLREVEMKQAKATIDDLYRTREKAELISGRIIRQPMNGHRDGSVIGRICFSLFNHAEKSSTGEAFMSKLAYVVPILPSGRESFSPSASYHRGPFPENRMHFISGAPHFAVEVRSENDYTPSAEQVMAGKREDYFQAGSEVVWDVDTVAECIHVYRATDPEHRSTFRRGDTADAEPAVPGWTVAVDWIFE
jgi:Uma2 family endonuclease